MVLRPLCDCFEKELSLPTPNVENKLRSLCEPLESAGENEL